MAIDTSALTYKAKNDETLLPQPENPKFRVALIGSYVDSHPTGGSDKLTNGHRFDTVAIANGLINSGVGCQIIFYNVPEHDKFFEIVAKFDGIVIRINPGQITANGGSQQKFDDDMMKVAAKIPVWPTPETMSKMGAKDALCQIKSMDFGLQDTLGYYSPDDISAGFRKTIAFQPRVVKQNRGSAGEGIWIIKLKSGEYCDQYCDREAGDDEMLILKEANDNHIEEHTVAQFIEFCVNGRTDKSGTWTSVGSGKYFEGGVEAGGQMVDQRFLPRIDEGEARFVMIGSELNRVEHYVYIGGVGGETKTTIYKPGDEGFPYGEIQKKLESEIPTYLQALGLPEAALPLLWAADFIPVDNHKSPYVIGEFNCSCLGLAGFLNVRGKDIKDLKDEDRDLGMKMANLIGEKCLESLEKNVPVFEFESDIKMPAVPEVSNVVEYTMQHWSKYGDSIAMISGHNGPETTFNQLEQKVRSCCAGMQAAGIKRGEVVALFASNCTEWVVAWMGTVLGGAIVTTINPAYGAEECEHQLKHAKAEYVICNGASMPAVLAAVKNHAVKNIWCFDVAEGAEPFEDLLKADAASAQCAKMDVKNDLVVIPYSSGTTGLPKGVMLTHYSVMYNMEQVRASNYLALGTDDTAIAVLPFYHIYGMAVLMVYALHVGTKMITMPKFDPMAYLEILKGQKVTKAFVAPPIVAFLAKHPAVDKVLPLTDLKDVFSAAAPLGEELALLCKNRLGLKCIRQGFGMTELSPVGTLATMDTVKPGSIGRVLPGITLKLVDPETGKPINVKSGERGEMWLKGENVMKGYLDNDKATAETIDSDGFLHTGDVAVMDKDGDLFIVDRLKELIKFKGFQVAPAELEALLLGCPDLADAGVIGVPAPRDGDGQVPKAFVVKKPDSTITEDGVKEFIAKQVVDYKRLHKVEFVDSIPKNPSGKILRKELRAREGNTFA